MVIIRAGSFERYAGNGAEFDIDFRDDLIPPAATLGDFVDMVEAVLRQKAVDRRTTDLLSADLQSAGPAANDINKEAL